MDRISFWKTLSDTAAPSGREAALAALLSEKLAPLCDRTKTDRAGNLIVSIAPANPTHRVMLVAHMDEVGFMIRSIDGDGRLRISLLGNTDTRVLSGRRVRLLNGTVGIASAKPIHVLSADERTKPTPTDRLYIELGTKDKAETETLTALGDFGTFEPKFKALQNGFYAGKALGGRSCVLLLCEVTEKLAAMKRAGTLRAEFDLVFSAKREIGGAMFASEAAAFALRPARALILDASPAADFGDATDLSCGCRCGKGVVLARADARTIYDGTFFSDAVTLAQKNGIAFQLPSTEAGAGTEAGAIHKSTSGVRTAFFGIPTRNLHSGAEIVQIKDVEAASSLLAKWIEKEND